MEQENGMEILEPVQDLESNQETDISDQQSITTYEIDMIDYTEMIQGLQEKIEYQTEILVNMSDKMQEQGEYARYSSGFLLFATMSILLWAIYRFFRIFF